MIDLNSSLKRIAWAYGCTKKGSPEETELQKLLETKVTDDLLAVAREAVGFALETGGMGNDTAKHWCEVLTRYSGGDTG